MKKWLLKIFEAAKQNNFILTLLALVIIPLKAVLLLCFAFLCIVLGYSLFFYAILSWLFIFITDRPWSATNLEPREHDDLSYFFYWRRFGNCPHLALRRDCRFQSNVRLCQQRTTEAHALSS